jgi:DNA-binding CsgD family transcriptional regulator
VFTTHDRGNVYQASCGTIPSSKKCLEEKIMERLHMNHLQDLLRRLRAGESERRIAQDMQISRPTVHKYHGLAKKEGYLKTEAEIPEDEALQSVLGPGPQPPKITSSVEPFGKIVKSLRSLTMSPCHIVKVVTKN